ncbi:hypothetical protein ACWEQK_22065 [Streptomyces parvulus]|uniref:hypothetical protein n=1 Tax=Streptomyces parvulus TaxID=146923 RepID=UPI00332B1544
MPGWFTLDQDITVDDSGATVGPPGAVEALSQVMGQFSAALSGCSAALRPAG